LPKVCHYRFIPIQPMRTVYQLIPDLQSSNPSLVLATVTATTGSAPQKPGSSALFGPNGLISGTVGGGVVEHKIGRIVKEAMESGRSGQYMFNLEYDIGSPEEAICGGSISILVDANPLEHLTVFNQITSSMAGRKPGVLHTMVTKIDDDRTHINRVWITKYVKNWNIPDLIRPLNAQINSLLASDEQTGFKVVHLVNDGQEATVFLELIKPLPRLVIAGAGHIGKALSHLGNLLDFEVTVIDDRPEYANPGNLPDADHILVHDIGTALAEMNISPDTFIVIVTRGHKDDAAALQACLGKEAAYIGMVGSARKIALMKQKFLGDKLCTQEQWEAIHTPVGLEIGSKTVQEIAVSIAAQLIQKRNQINLK